MATWYIHIEEPDQNRLQRQNHKSMDNCCYEEDQRQRADLTTFQICVDKCFRQKRRKKDPESKPLRTQPQSRIGDQVAAQNDAQNNDCKHRQQRFKAFQHWR